MEKQIVLINKCENEKLINMEKFKLYYGKKINEILNIFHILREAL